MHSTFLLPWAPPLAELTIDSLMDPLRCIGRRQTVGEIALTTFFMYSTALPTAYAARLGPCACFNNRLRLRQLRAGMPPPSLLAVGTFKVLCPRWHANGEGSPNSHCTLYEQEINFHYINPLRVQCYFSLIYPKEYPADQN